MASAITLSPEIRIADEATDRTRAILNAAHDLLNEAGLEGLTIRAVLSRTGLARRAFYERFASKDDLVLAIFEETLHGAARQYADLATRIGDPIETLRLIVGSLVLAVADPDDDRIALLPQSRRSSALSREHLRLAESRPAELQAALDPLLSLIAALLRQGIGEGRVRECDAELHARLIYNLVASTVHTQLLAEEGARADGRRRRILSEQIWEFCRRAMAA